MALSSTGTEARPKAPSKPDATLLASNSQHCWMLHVASICTPGPVPCCCVLLGVVAQSLKLVNSPTILPFVASVCTLLNGPVEGLAVESQYSFPGKNNHPNQPFLPRIKCAFAREVDSFRFRFRTL